jgi:hypothetical protein
VTNLDIGLEVMYTKIETAFAGGVTGCATAGCLPIGFAGGTPFATRMQDNDVWSGILRIQRNFWP